MAGSPAAQDFGMSAFRFSLLASVMLAASACAANPIAPAVAPIDYRSINPAGQPVAVRPPSQAAPLRAPAAPAPPPRVADMGTSSSPAVLEAKAMPAEASSRPGGALIQPRDNPASRRIQVQPGDTLYDISRRYSVNMRALIETNRLEPPYALNPGATVNLPPPNLHRVERGETLYSVSRRYNVDTRSLALLNGMSRPWTIYPGDELMLPPLARDQGRVSVPVPTPVKVAPPAAKPSKPAGQMVAEAPIILAPGAAAAAIPKVPAAVTPAPKSPSTKPPAPKPKLTETPNDAHEFIWPVSGNVTKSYGAGSDGGRNDGVNIDVPRGTQVKAAASGEVVYAGDELVGFGNLVLIRHSGGWVTAYAYADSLKVKEGDMVAQGQAIAISGATGNAGSPQLHFELRKGKEPVDPADYLPALKG
jgi:murein DD-endopeptidase MepM/ murein hydrolase activator NlpD